MDNSSIWRSIVFWIGLILVLVVLGIVFFPSH